MKLFGVLIYVRNINSFLCLLESRWCGYKARQSDCDVYTGNLVIPRFEIRPNFVFLCLRHGFLFLIPKPIYIHTTYKAFNNHYIQLDLASVLWLPLINPRFPSVVNLPCNIILNASLLLFPDSWDAIELTHR